MKDLWRDMIDELEWNGFFEYKVLAGALLWMIFNHGEGEYVINVRADMRKALMKCVHILNATRIKRGGWESGGIGVSYYTDRNRMFRVWGHVDMFTPSNVDVCLQYLMRAVTRGNGCLEKPSGWYTNGKGKAHFVDKGVPICPRGWWDRSLREATEQDAKCAYCKRIHS